MKNSFAPIFSKIVDSSVWQEPYPVRVLWTTMLALKDADHVVRFNAFALSRRANMSEQEVLDSLKVLMAPDTRRLEPQAFDGRRVEKVPDGYFILNGQAYENMMRELSTKVYKAKWMREKRARKRKDEGPVSGKYLARENRFEAAVEEGNEQLADQISGEGIPDQISDAIKKGILKV